MARILYFDCFSGASGDMVLGALVDAGLPIEELRGAVGRLALEGVNPIAERTERGGIGATRFRAVDEPHDGARPASGTQTRETPRGHHADAEDLHPGHTHAFSRPHAPARTNVAAPHAPGTGTAHVHPPPHCDDAQDGHAPKGGHHEHRHAADIVSLIARSGLSAGIRTRASELVWRLAEIEAAIHGVPVESVHLHEVGALDSIVDIVGGVFAIEWFGARRIVSSPLNTGSGLVRCAHGVLPVPAPATARLIHGVPSYAEGPAVELLTPTGALLITGHATEYGPRPPMSIERVGYGAGARDFPDRPNLLRVFVGEDGDTTTERVVVIECEIDDMNPQWFGALLERALAAGALDVFFVPAQMKKSRPGTLVTLLARPADREALVALLFRETTTLGVRYHEMQRQALERRTESVDTPYGAVRVKVAFRGGMVVTASPEFEDCLRLSAERQAAVKDVHAAAVAAWMARRG